MAAEHSLFPRAMSLAVHELRTPVTVVAGYLRMLLREQAGPLTDRQRKMLEEAERSCGRIGALVAEMSDLGKLEAGLLAFSRQDFDLGALIAEVAGDMHEGGDRGMQLEVRTTDQSTPVTGDRARLGFAARTLLHLVLRERGEPGVVVASCSRASDGAGDWAVAAVGDEADLEPLHDRMKTGPVTFDEWRGGMGLALPVVRRIIDAHGGAVWTVGGGGSRTAAAFRLPIRA